MPNKLTIERQQAIHQELQAVQQTMTTQQTAPAPADIAATISALAKIVSELLAAFGHSDHAQAVDRERARPR